MGWAADARGRAQPPCLHRAVRDPGHAPGASRDRPHRGHRDGVIHRARMVAGGGDAGRRARPRRAIPGASGQPRRPTGLAVRTGRRTDPVLRCTGRCVLPCSCTGSPSPSGSCSSGTSRTRPIPNSFYYVDVARALTAGDGFNVDFIWIFPEVGGGIPPDPVLPIPSNAHWMPLASIVQVPFLALFGTGRVGVRAPVRAHRRAGRPADLGGRPRRPARSASVAVGAAILTAIPVLSLVYMTQPDNFSIYQPLVVGALWMGASRAQGLAARVRSCRTPDRARDALAQRRPARPRRARPGRSSGTAGGRGGRRTPDRRSRRARPSPASACSSW